MPNKNKKWNREDWISVVITLVFVLGFLVLANSGTEMTGLTTVEQPTTIDFEVNSVIPSTAVLEISSGTQVQQMNLSEFTIKLSELQNIQPVLEEGKLVAYNITNMTIDLSEYNIDPVDSVNIRFLKVYKDITKETVTKKITKEEVVTEEIVSVTKEPEFRIQPTEEKTEEPEFGIQQVYTVKTFYLTGPHITDTGTSGITTTRGTGLTHWNSTAADEAGTFIATSSFYSEETNLTAGTAALNVTIWCYSSASGGGAKGDIKSTEFFDCSDSVCTDSTSICSSAIKYECQGSIQEHILNCDPAGYTMAIGRYLAVEINTDVSGAPTLVYFNSSADPYDSYIQVTEQTKAAVNNAPTVEINFPKNNTYSISHYTNFTYNVSDADAGVNGEIINCTLLIQQGGSWLYNMSNSTAISEGTNETFNITLGHENINWTVQCEDGGGLKANATQGIFNYTVYDSTPEVSAIFPKNNTWEIFHSVNFTYNVSSRDSVANCSLWLQKAGSWGLNKTNATGVTEDVNQTINITLGHETVNWTIGCYNTYYEQGNSSIFNYSVYDATPAVELIFPKNNTYREGPKQINFTYHVKSNDSDLTCDLYINHGWNSTNTNIERNVNQTFNLTFASYQNLNWSVGCNNSFNEYTNSTTYNFSSQEISNQAPTILWINVSTPGDTSIILDDKKSVSFTFVACDPDGSADIDQGFGNLTGMNNTAPYQDKNLTCVETAWTNTTCKQFNCSWDMWYWYKAGSWNFSANVTDGTEWAHTNKTNFKLGSTTGMVIWPTSLTFTTLYLDNTNKTSNNDPININNTGNYNVSLSKVNVTAYNLRGETNATQEIPAANFTVDIDTGGDSCSGAECIECDGTAMANATSVNIVNSMLARGNHSIGAGASGDGKTGFENITFCLTHVPPFSMIGVQSYSTTNSVQWVIGVS